jgi:hypothetical protein
MPKGGHEGHGFPVALRNFGHGRHTILAPLPLGWRGTFEFVGDDQVCPSTIIANNALGAVRLFGVAAR